MIDFKEKKYWKTKHRKVINTSRRNKRREDIERTRYKMKEDIASPKLIHRHHIIQKYSGWRKKIYDFILSNIGKDYSEVLENFYKILPPDSYCRNVFMQEFNYLLNAGYHFWWPFGFHIDQNGKIDWKKQLSNNSIYKEKRYPKRLIEYNKEVQLSTSSLNILYCFDIVTKKLLGLLDNVRIIDIKEYNRRNLYKRYYKKRYIRVGVVGYGITYNGQYFMIRRENLIYK